MTSTALGVLSYSPIHSCCRSSCVGIDSGTRRPQKPQGAFLLLLFVLLLLLLLQNNQQKVENNTKTEKWKKQEKQLHKQFDCSLDVAAAAALLLLSPLAAYTPLNWHSTDTSSAGSGGRGSGRGQPMLHFLLSPALFPLLRCRFVCNHANKTFFMCTWICVSVCVCACKILTQIFCRHAIFMLQ